MLSFLFFSDRQSLVLTRISFVFVRFTVRIIFANIAPFFCLHSRPF